MHSDNLAERYGALEKLPTQELDRLLQTELEKEDADPAEVKTILAVLREREKDMPLEISDSERLAWQRYTSHEKEEPQRKRSWALRIASAATVVCVLMVAIAYNVEAEGFWGRIVRWTDSVIEFFGPDRTGGEQPVYEFETDHPGLQQVYDTAARIGITEPVVPMWLPEGYAITCCQRIETDNKTTIMSVFQNGEKMLNYNIAIYSEDVSNQYQKDKTEVKMLEIHDISHYIVRNMDKWVAVWTKDNIECSISVNCQEDELYKILRSVYDKEEVQ